jgi:hypothetical protein
MRHLTLLAACVGVFALVGCGGSTDRGCCGKPEACTKACCATKPAGEAKTCPAGCTKACCATKPAAAASPASAPAK